MSDPLHTSARMANADDTAARTAWRLPGMPALLLFCLFGFGSFFFTLSAAPLRAVAGGAPEALAGLVTTAMLAATIGAQLAVPSAITRIGPAAVLATGLLALGGASPLLLIDDHLWWIVVVGVVRGAGFGVVTVLTPVIATAIAPPRLQGSAIGASGLAIAVPNLLALPVAVALTANGHFTVVACLAACPLLALPLVPGLARTITRAAAAAPIQRAPSRSDLGRLAAVTVVLLITTLTAGGIYAILPVQSPVGRLATVGLLVFGVFGAAARYWSGQLADRRSPRGLLLAGLACGVGGTGLVAGGFLHVHNGGAAALVLVGLALLGCSVGTVQNVTLVLAFDAAGPAGRTTASSVWNAAYDAGTAVGALLVGALTAGLTFSWALMICAAAIAVTVVPSVRSTARPRPGRP